MSSTFLSMADVTIDIIKHGPLIVKGEVEMKDADGKSYPAQKRMALCRCGASTEKPFTVALLIDTSGSVHGRFQFEQDAANGFLQHTIRPHYDHAFVMGFNGHNKVIQDFTDSTSLLAAGVQRLEAGGGTALFQAIYTACKEKLLKDDSDRPTRRALIVPLGTSQ